MDLSFAFSPWMVGLKFYTQLVLSDAGMAPIPVALSNGQETAVPGAPVFQKSVAAGTTWQVDSAWQTSMTLTKDNGVVIGF